MSTIAKNPIHTNSCLVGCIEFSVVFLFPGCAILFSSWFRTLHTQRQPSMGVCYAQLSRSMVLLLLWHSSSSRSGPPQSWCLCGKDVTLFREDCTLSTRRSLSWQRPRVQIIGKSCSRLAPREPWCQSSFQNPAPDDVEILLALLQP